MSRLTFSFVALGLIASTGCSSGSSQTPSSPPPTPTLSPLALSLTPGVWYPAAPDQNHFAWQSRQDRLISVLPVQAGDWPNPRMSQQRVETCDQAGIVLGMGWSSLCYVDAARQLWCAGTVADNELVFGNRFVFTGQADVDQLFPADFQNLCVHKRDGTAWCLGWGQKGEFNLGPSGGYPGTSWTQWGTRRDIQELATGTGGQICARYADGTADCTGLMADGRHYTPERIGGPFPPVQQLRVDDNGNPFVNDNLVFRQGNGFSGCLISTGGMTCNAYFAGDVTTFPPVFGVPGQVVDGNGAGEWGYGLASTACWLSADGTVTCREPLDPANDQSPGTSRSYFGEVPGRALALAVSVYAYSTSLTTTVPPARCAAFDDGSLWCIGANSRGMFGTGNLNDLTAETQVAPPGSVGIHCPRPVQ